MSDSFPTGAVPIAILAGLLWIVDPVWLFSLLEPATGDAPLGIGMLFAVLFGRGGRNVLVLVLTVSILWRVFRDPRSLREFDRAIQVAAVSGAAFVFLASPVTDVLYNFFPREETPLISRSVLVAGSICAAVTIGSVLLGKLSSARPRTGSDQ
ncbi:hypothetical protein HPS36_06815 [Halorubrum salinarum]|uniref:Uncharacterized protein n=1 Tax=Halorubrum salinarum TaxID=2739057 RepID=A0A7D3YM50_9EURY|nr:hypothetical protein [Halorubrum salinarum]QKG92566.1 hypothetical protein HPS36_06815 [Halorubrum salinarum]